MNDGVRSSQETYLSRSLPSLTDNLSLGTIGLALVCFAIQWQLTPISRMMTTLPQSITVPNPLQPEIRIHNLATTLATRPHRHQTIPVDFWTSTERRMIV